SLGDWGDGHGPRRRLSAHRRPQAKTAHRETGTGRVPTAAPGAPPVRRSTETAPGAVRVNAAQKTPPCPRRSELRVDAAVHPPRVARRPSCPQESPKHALRGATVQLPNGHPLTQKFALHRRPHLAGAQDAAEI